MAEVNDFFGEVLPALTQADTAFHNGDTLPAWRCGRGMILSRCSALA